MTSDEACPACGREFVFSRGPDESQPEYWNGDMCVTSPPSGSGRTYYHV